MTCELFSIVQVNETTMNPLLDEVLHIFHVISVRVLQENDEPNLQVTKLSCHRRGFNVPTTSPIVTVTREKTLVDDWS
jgi:hypothetical protein